MEKKKKIFMAKTESKRGRMTRGAAYVNLVISIFL